MLATSATSFPGAAALRTPLQPKHDIHEHRDELTFVTQNLFANEEASPHHRARAFASFLLQTRPQFAAVQELMPWNAQILLESPVLRKLYPHAAADLLSGGEPPWTYVFGSLPRLDRRHFPGVAGWRGLDVAFFNASQHTVLTVASAHFTADECPTRSVEDGGADDAPCPGGAARAADLDEALRILERVGTRDAVLLGDLNFGDQPHLFGAELKALRGWPSWRDAWAEANGTAGFTWDNRRSSLNKLCGADCADAGAFTLPSARLDHALLRGRVRARVAALINDEPIARHEPCGGGDAACGPLFVSDHFGVSFRLTLDGGGVEKHLR